MCYILWQTVVSYISLLHTQNKILWDYRIVFVQYRLLHREKTKHFDNWSHLYKKWCSKLEIHGECEFHHSISQGCPTCKHEKVCLFNWLMALHIFTCYIDLHSTLTDSWRHMRQVSMGSIARHCMPPVKDILTNYNKKHPQTEYILISTYNIYGLICANDGRQAKQPLWWIAPLWPSWWL